MPSVRPGKITVITGPMFSEKTLRGISAIHKALHAGKKVQVFRPDIPTRMADEDAFIVSRFGVKYPATTISSFEEFFTKILSPDTDSVFFDEGQFFDEDIVNIVKILRKDGKDATVIGLDLSVFEEPFGYMPQLMALAQEVIKTTASCKDCGDDAHISYRLTGESDKVLVGDKNYIALCYDCYYDRKESG